MFGSNLKFVRQTHALGSSLHTPPLSTSTGFSSRPSASFYSLFEQLTTTSTLLPRNLLTPALVFRPRHRPCYQRIGVQRREDLGRGIRGSKTYSTSCTSTLQPRRVLPIASKNGARSAADLSDAEPPDIHRPPTFVAPAPQTLPPKSCPLLSHSRIDALHPRVRWPGSTPPPTCSTKRENIPQCLPSDLIKLHPVLDTFCRECPAPPPGAVLVESQDQSALCQRGRFVPVIYKIHCFFAIFL
ncbi:hypothetical protein R3P38DRAFT_3192786 [Favolaschia claudopus]|uniref:Uncharacterized protein n=1 Tax=Favolaschia claudopus TaxID=2862362 RepID=A0AAW0BIL4_9AGAR